MNQHRNDSILKRAALVYDFDGTLAPGNMQEHSFIPAVGMTKKDFWEEVKSCSKKEDADEILVYMRLMIEKAKQKCLEITKDDLGNHGRKIPLFEGLKDQSWFDRINCHGATNGLGLEHYIISSGLEEMIRGCSIFQVFRHVFASKFIYENDIAVWPGAAINYTSKTQYLFRINKGIDNQWDNDTINKYMAEHERPIPFQRMIFVGDGFTDIPAMKMMTHQGGNAVAVYDPECKDQDLGKIHQLIADNRVDFVAPADYSENSQMEIIVKGILSRMARSVEKIGTKYPQRRNGVGHDRGAQ